MAAKSSFHYYYFPMFGEMEVRLYQCGSFQSFQGACFSELYKYPSSCRQAIINNFPLFLQTRILFLCTECPHFQKPSAQR